MGYLEQLYDLNGKVAVMTGGGVLGSAMAHGLSQCGVKMAILDIKQEAADQLAQQVKQEGGEAIALQCNVLERDSLDKARQAVMDHWNRVDILINGAGGNMPGATVPPDKTFFDISIDDFKKVMDLNLLGTVMPTQVFGEIMADQKEGMVLNLSSMTAQQAVTRVAGYSAAKASVDNFTRWMATELAQKYGEGLRVNAIAPGFFIGEQNRRLLTNEDGSLTERGETIIRNTPMGRFGEADEIVGTVLWLCSAGAKFVTGVVVPIDGGFSAYSGV